MKRLFFYIFPLLSILAVSCRDDIYNNDGCNDDGTMSLSIALDVPESRTRAIDMADGAAVYLNKIWVGIYRKSDGKRVGGTDLDNETDLSNRLTESGAIIYNVVNVIDYGVGINVNEENGNKFCVVAVANYDGIYSNKIKPKENDQEGTGKEYFTLFEELKNADTWKDFIDISINTRQNLPYATPLLMGYLSQTDNLTMVNQFSNENINISGNEKIFIEGNINDNGKLISLKKEENTNWLLRLRRLRSKINIKIKPGDGINITNLEYKVFNVPNSSFLAERHTNDMKDSSTIGWQFSPNSADRDNEGYEDGYDDIEWINPQDNYNFSFEHFENKHWAYDPLLGYDNEEALGALDETKQYHERETKNSDGSLVGLVGDEESSGYLGKGHWNNNASYFILKMQILDKNTNRNAEVEYTIHEGFINSIEGEDLSNEAITKRLPDFACIRNTDYTYNITVNGVKDIVTQVTTDSHENDQKGSVWQINRLFTNKDDTEKDLGEGGKTVLIADLIKNSQVLLQKGIVDKSGNLHFENPKDIAFRFIGTSHKNGEITPIDICYNFARGELDGFADLWKAPGSHTDYLVDTDVEDATYYLKNYSDPNFNELIEKIKVIPADGSQMLNIKEYIAKYVENYDENKSNNPNPDIKGFWLAGDSYSSRDENELRGLYIFDREQAIIGGSLVDKDSKPHSGTSDDPYCSLYQIYGVERYPKLFEKVPFDINNILWDNDYYKMVSTVDEVFAATTPIFYGSINSKIDLRWEHDPRISGYKIRVYLNDTKATYANINVLPEDLPQYLYDVNGEKVFIYPLNTSSFTLNSNGNANNYSFSVTPVVDETTYIAGETVDIIHDTTNDDTCIRVCPTLWDITSTKDWKALVTPPTNSFEIYYRGLKAFSSTKKSSSSVGSYFGFGGAGNTTDRYFSFWASVPGKITVKCKSTSGADASRQLVIARMGDNGKSVNKNNEKYDIVYESKAMGNSNDTSYTSPDLTLNNGEPTEFRIYTEGNVYFYKFEFTPSN